MKKIRQFSEDKKVWVYGGAGPFNWVRFIEVDKDGKRTEGKPQAIEPTERDPADVGYELK